MLIRLRGLKFNARATSQLDQVIRFFRRDVMPIYISRGRFTSDAVKGMVAKPENRKQAVSKLFESVGGRLIEWYLTFG
ncbi:MAG: GYD domain-containing protein, partial [Pseudolabrys sp.]